VRLQRGLFPDGSFLDVSKLPVFTIGRRYLLLLPNHSWLRSPVRTETTFRIDTVGNRDILVDQEGYAVINIHGGRSSDPVSTSEKILVAPELIIENAEIADAAMTLEEYLAALMNFSESYDGAVFDGPYSAFPLVPSTIFGTQ